MTMQCPSCLSLQTTVRDSRPVNGAAAIRRRRLCLACSHRFVTVEHNRVSDSQIRDELNKTLIRYFGWNGCAEFASSFGPGASGGAAIDTAGGSR